MKFSIVLCLLFTSRLCAQTRSSTDSSEVKTIGGIVHAVLRLVSNKTGEKRDWDAFRNLFLPSCTFTVVNPGDSFPQPVETENLEDFIKTITEDSDEIGYTEWELGKTMDHFNGIANVFQSFVGIEADHNRQRGINSYQLVYFNRRWYVANLIWTLETKGTKIPQKYLGTHDAKQ